MRHHHRCHYIASPVQFFTQRATDLDRRRQLYEYLYEYLYEWTCSVNHTHTQASW